MLSNFAVDSIVEPPTEDHSSQQPETTQGQATKRQKKEQILNVPSNALILGSKWDATADKSPLHRMRDEFIRQYFQTYQDYKGRGYKIVHSGSNRNGLVIGCITDGKISRKKSKCTLRLVGQNDSNYSARVKHICLTHTSNEEYTCPVVLGCGMTNTRHTIIRHLNNPFTKDSVKDMKGKSIVAETLQTKQIKVTLSQVYRSKKLFSLTNDDTST